MRQSLIAGTALLLAGLAPAHAESSATSQLLRAFASGQSLRPVVDEEKGFLEVWLVRDGQWRVERVTPVADLSGIALHDLRTRHPAPNPPFMVIARDGATGHPVSWTGLPSPVRVWEAEDGSIQSLQGNVETARVFVPYREKLTLEVYEGHHFREAFELRPPRPAQPGPGVVDVLIVPEGFIREKELKEFAAIADKLAKGLGAHATLGAHDDRIRWAALIAPSDCKNPLELDLPQGDSPVRRVMRRCHTVRSKQKDRYLYVDENDEPEMQRVASEAYPGVDSVVVIRKLVDSSAGGGSAFSAAKLGWMVIPEKASPNLPIHEFGHILGLLDEYQDGWEGAPAFPEGPNVASKASVDKRNTGWENFCASQRCDRYWGGDPSRVGYWYGAYYHKTDYFRSSYACIMNGLGTTPFCCVCERAIQQMFDRMGSWPPEYLYVEPRTSLADSAMSLDLQILSGLVSSREATRAVVTLGDLPAVAEAEALRIGLCDPWGRPNGTMTFEASASWVGALIGGNPHRVLCKLDVRKRGDDVFVPALALERD